MSCFASDHLRLRVRAILMDGLVELSCVQLPPSAGGLDMSGLARVAEKPSFDSAYHSLEYDADIVSIFTQDFPKPIACAPQASGEGRVCVSIYL